MDAPWTRAALVAAVGLAVATSACGQSSKPKAPPKTTAAAAHGAQTTGGCQRVAVSSSSGPGYVFEGMSVLVPDANRIAKAIGAQDWAAAKMAIATGAKDYAGAEQVAKVAGSPSVCSYPQFLTNFKKLLASARQAAGDASSGSPGKLAKAAGELDGVQAAEKALSADNAALTGAKP